MSGYLDVKYPLKSNLGLNPFKSWRRQWCILRPSPTFSGGCLAVYCSEAGAAAGVIELPAGSVVRRAKSRSKAYAFAVFGIDDRKPRVLLAAQSHVDAQSWMDKIRALLNGETLLGTESLLKDSFSISLIPTDLAQTKGLNGNGTLSIMINGIRITNEQQTMFVEWKYIQDVSVATEDKDRICIVKIDSDSPSGGGGGELKLRTPLAGQIRSAARARRGGGCGAGGDQRSRSDGDLHGAGGELEERRTSWYSGPSEVSLDDIDLVMSKESLRAPVGLSRRVWGAGEEPAAAARPRLRSCNVPLARTRAPTPASAPALKDDSISDRRSLVSLASVASGIYEEIPEPPDHDTSNTYCTMTNNNAALPATDNVTSYARPPMLLDRLDRFDRLDREEPTYESVTECVFATMRRAPRAPRARPPPLPPRHALGTKMGESWNSRLNAAVDGAGGAGLGVARHSSLGSLPRCCSVSVSVPATGGTARSLPAPAPPKNTFNVFRKRLKSDSRITTSPNTSKENKDVETKKKKFDFPPPRDIFKSFKVSKKMKNLKITTNLTKGETKSCEFLDETEHVSSKRCSKSVECLEDSNEFLDDEADLSLEFNDDAVSALALPQEIVDLILRGREQVNKIRLQENQVECDYMPMSPAARAAIPHAPIEHHYIVMSPKANLV